MTTEEVGTDPQPNWRDLSSYDYTRNLMREDWAWEFLRRNPAYADIAATIHAAASECVRRTPAIRVIDPGNTGDAGLAWGLHFLRSCTSPLWCGYRLLAGRCQSCRSSRRSLPRPPQRY